jgi:hypothetical protein
MDFFVSISTDQPTSMH